MSERKTEMSKLSNISLQYVKSVGPKRASAFSNAGLNSVEDLLFYFPSKYLDRSNILTVPQIMDFLRNGYEGEVTLMGIVYDKEIIRYGRRQIMKALLTSGNETFECIWFAGIKYFKDLFNQGETYAVSGKPVITRYGHLQIAHPDFDLIDEKENRDFFNTGKIIPFYPLPQKIKTANIGVVGLRRIISNAVSSYADKAEESLPDYLTESENLLDIKDALRNIHFPATEELLKKAWERFKFEELFYFELLVALRKFKYKEELKGLSFEIKPEPIKTFLNSLHFELTKAQLKVLHEIRLDMQSRKPMNRLLQGDVGSGKTIVAVIAMIIASSNNYQSVLMAPTEILADQHFRSITKLLEPLKLKVVNLVGGQKKSVRKEILQEIKSGGANVVVGTHALFEEGVEFENLGLVVIDEQHRFGVEQRGKLINKGYAPDVIVMSATPIPRTLTMTVYGDLDVSVIDEMPAGRKPVKTFLRGDSKLPEIFEFVKKKIREGDQAFIVYPLVEESEKLELKAAEKYFTELSKNVFPDFKVGLIHGKMPWREKEDAMLRFSRKEFDMLVSTTVIEVGIDVPSANVIVINDAFRFGLSQLHQLRGRVGRSSRQGYAILVAKDKYLKRVKIKDVELDYLSPKERERYKAFIRLRAMEKYTDGFKLAEIDLKLRGPGNIFGTEQSGLPQFKYADLIEDGKILKKARRCAFDLIKKDPSLKDRNNDVIKQNLFTKYRKHFDYIKIG